MAGSGEQGADRARCLRLASASPDQTIAIGEALGRHLAPGDVVVLSGALGAGKTALTQGIARGMRIPGYVTSPTFTLVNEYQPPRPGAHAPLYHVDLYRTSGAAEALDFGLDEYLLGGGVTVVEWPERAPEALPTAYLLVTLRLAGDGRSLTICPVGPRFLDRMSALGRALAAYAAGD